MKELYKINGHEIIEHLKNLLEEDEAFCDTCFNGPIEFEDQSFNEDRGEYTLKFTGHFNNWGTYQPIDGNKIIISEKGVYTRLDEPFCDDETGDVIKEVLTKWLETHEFESSDDIQIKWRGMVQFCQEKLGELKYKDIEILDNVIEELKEARTLMK